MKPERAAVARNRPVAAGMAVINAGEAVRSAFVQTVASRRRGTASGSRDSRMSSHSIEHDPSRTHRRDLRAQPRQQAAQVERAGLHRIRAGNAVQEKKLFRRQPVQVPAEAPGVGADAVCGFLERNEYSRIPAPVAAVGPGRATTLLEAGK